MLGPQAQRGLGGGWAGQRDLPTFKGKKASSPRAYWGSSYEIHSRRANEASHVGVGWAAVDVVGRADLLQHAVFHDGNAAAQRHGLDLVVRHIHTGDAAELVQALDLGAHLYAQLGVQVGQRLVKQKQLRVPRQGPSHGHPLTLAARELGRSAIQQVLDLQHGGHLSNALGAGRLGHLAHFQRKADVVGHAHGGVKGVALEHHGDVALGRGHAQHIAPGNAQLALARLFKPGNDVEQGGLAAARGPDQDQKLTRSHVDVDALEHLHRALTLAKHLADARDLYCCCHLDYPFTAPAVSPLTKYWPAST